jgi:hypothetical protein
MNSAEIGLLRFMRARTDETGVHDEPDPAWLVLQAAPRLTERLTIAVQWLRAASVSADGPAVSYETLVVHPAYVQYRAVARELNAFDPWSLGAREARLAF